MRSMGTIGLLCLALAVAGAAYAGDGVLEINQSCVATGCFAGDTAGFPVTIATSGSYRLTSNIADVSSAITISGDSVTLDLGGFTLDGQGRCTGTPVTSCAGAGVSSLGITVSGDQVRIRNGIVRGYGNANIRFADCATGCTLEDVMVTESAADGATVLQAGTAELLFRNVDIVRNGDEGFDQIGGGVRMTVDQSRIAGNGDIGAEGMTLSTFTNTRFSSNGSFGLDCTECALGNCSFWGNGGSEAAPQFSVGTLRSMGGVVCDDGSCP